MSVLWLLGLYYAYPASLLVTFLISHLLTFRQEKLRIELLDREKSYELIWYLQACILPSLFISLACSVFEFQHTPDSYPDSQLLQAQLASYIALLIYFGSGLLPDPDGPFKPCRSNCHAWFIAIVFEVSIISIIWIIPSQANYIKTITCSLGALRAAILILIVAIFQQYERRSFWRISTSDVERQSLISPTTSNSNYGVTSSTLKQGVQRVGWLDYFYGFQRLFPYIWPSDSRNQQLITILCFALLILQRIVNIMVPRQLGLLVESLGVGSMPYKHIALYCIYRGLQGQQGIIGSIRAILWIPISQSLYSRLTSAAYSHVLLLSLDFHLSKRIGEVMSALSKGASLNTFLDGFAFQLFPMVLDLGIAAFYLFFTFGAFYPIIVLTVMWSYVFVTIYMAKYRAKARREMASRDRDMDAAKTDAIMAYEMVHYNGAIPLEISKFGQLVTAFQRAEFSVLFSLNKLNATQNGIFIIGVILVCILSAYQISIGLYRISDFVTLITYFAQLQAPLAFFGSFYNQVQNNLVEAERMLELFNISPNVVDSPEAEPISKISSRLVVSNLSFAYGYEKSALENISFTVEPGTSTAIVGESGSGKSTILKLLFRFYNPSNGHIYVDNVDTQKITIESLRSHIGVVPQETVLFNESLMYNLTYARQDATEEEVFEACRAASIDEKIKEFPAGYRTVVGERGLKLSGGEKQRVAIARAILKNPQIMLLDEATASLDTHTEKLIQGALENVTRGRTTIIVAHRLSTITHADQILVLHLGRIVERGTHRELLAKGGRYAGMWQKQTEMKDKKGL